MCCKVPTSEAVGKRPTLTAVSPAAEGDNRTLQQQSQIEDTEGHNTIHTLSICSLAEYHVAGSVDGVPVQFLVDNGAAVTVVRSDIWSEISKNDMVKPLEATGKTLVGVQERPLDVQGIASVTINLSAEEFGPQVFVVDALSSQAILGRDFLKLHKCLIDMEVSSRSSKKGSRSD